MTILHFIFLKYMQKSTYEFYNWYKYHSTHFYNILQFNDITAYSQYTYFF